MAYEYSNNEYTEMVRVLAKSNDNVARACHEFVRLYPNLPAPSRDLMLQATQRLRDHGQFQSSSSGLVSEEDEEGQDSEGDGEEGDDEEGGDEEGDCEGEDDEEGNEEYEEELKEDEKEEALKPMPQKEPTESPVPLLPRRGFPLGLIKNVEVSLSRFKTQDQKILHQYLYGQICPDRNVTENIKNFRGFQWKFDSTEYKAKLMETARMEPRHLRAMCEMLDLENYGGPSKLAQRLMDFLQQPGASFPNVPRRPLIMTDNRDAAVARGLRRTRSHSPPSVTCHDEEYESDQDTKANDSKENSEDSDGSGSVKSSASEASDAGSEGEEVIGTEGREAEAKVIPDRKRPLPKIYNIDKKNARDMLVRSTQGEKASSEESYVGEDSSEEEEEEGSDEEDSEEESDKPADKKAKRPPTDEEIKKCVRQILERANLETITMKTLCKQVYSHYPDFDLEHKKDFIKATVKSLL